MTLRGLVGSKDTWKPQLKKQALEAYITLKQVESGCVLVFPFDHGAQCLAGSKTTQRTTGSRACSRRQRRRRGA
jgi:hypothetical protein